MTKPDWAERLQRTFSRNYNKGKQAKQDEVIALLNEVKSTWVKTPTFNYRKELDSLITRIEGEK